MLVAEIVKHFHPRLVDLHNYIPACSTDQKLSNWSLLNRQGLERRSQLSEAGTAGSSLTALWDKFPAVGPFPSSAVAGHRA